MIHSYLNRFKNLKQEVVLFTTLSFLIFTQFISLHHQVQHLNDYNDIACVQCISTPDSLDSFSTILFFVSKLEKTPYQLASVTDITLQQLNLHFARAPPSIA